MRIIIELDSNNQPDIKTSQGAYNEAPGIYSSPSSALDAGFAKIPEPELRMIGENESAMPDMDTGTQGNNAATGIDAGSFNGSQSDGDGNTIMSSHQNNLATAVSSGSALDAGGPKLADVDNGDTLAALESGPGMFDRSNAISGGEFINAEII